MSDEISATKVLLVTATLKKKPSESRARLFLNAYGDGAWFGLGTSGARL